MKNAGKVLITAKYKFGSDGQEVRAIETLRLMLEAWKMHYVTSYKHIEIETDLIVLDCANTKKN